MLQSRESVVEIKVCGFRIANVCFWSCIERLWKFTVSKKAAVVLHRLNLLLALQAKCWSDSRRVTIFPQSMLSSRAISPSSAVMLETKSSYLFIPRNVRHNVFLLYAPVPIIKTIAGWNWSRENDVEEISYFLNTCWGIFFKQNFPFVLFFQMWPLVLLAPSKLEYLLSKMFISPVLCCGQTRRKRSETSCKITLI